MPDTHIALPGSEKAIPSHAQNVRPADPNERVTVSVYLKGRGQPLPTEALPGLEVAYPPELPRVARVTGTVPQLEAAFGVTLHHAELEGRTCRLREGAVHVPKELDGIVAGVFGLDNRPIARPHLRFHPQVDAHAINRAYKPQDVAKAYGLPPGLNGYGEGIALIELGGGYRDTDLINYFSPMGVPLPRIVSVGVDGAQNVPGGDPQGADGEVELDIQVAGAVAPAALIKVFFAPNSDQGFIDAINQAVHDPQITLISISWGSAEVYWSAQALGQYDAVFQDAVALGKPVFAASGDDGSDDNVGDGQSHADFPASSPHVTGCGGTSLQLSGSSVTSEVAWGSLPNGGASGGGFSTAFPKTPWQATAFGVHTGRGVPDVAGNADPQTGYLTLVDGRQTVIGGTSAVAPLMAGAFACLNQALLAKGRKRVGFLNPVLYAHPKTFRDIASGTNGAWQCHAGWDAVVGLGVPWFNQVLTLF